MSASIARVEVVEVAFGLAGDADNEREGRVGLTNYDLFNGPFPVEGGVYDARMGTTGHEYRCLTCAHQRRECPGHPGRLDTRVAVLQPLGIAEVRRWLKAVCLSCGAPMLDAERLARLPPGERLGAAGSTEGKPCPACRTPHPRVVKDPSDGFSFWLAPPREEGERPASSGAVPPGAEKLLPGDIALAFGRVSSAALRALGRRPEAAHPTDLVLRTVPVPPVTIRPGVKVGPGSGPGAQSYHDLNNLIQYLVRHVQQLPARIELAQLRQALQVPAAARGTGSQNLARQAELVSMLYQEFVLGSAGAAGGQAGSGRRAIVAGSRPPPSLARRLPGKQGRLRRNLLGTRVWNISRATISGNSDLRVDEVGFPVAFARVVQVAETVQAFNLDRLMRFFRNGRRAYPGCSRVEKRSTGATHDVSNLREDFRLEPGDVIHRDVVTGDVCYFNRQPSLERSSMGVHRVVVIQDPSISTLQLNVIACSQYNADFDGDQMNAVVVSGAMAQAEAPVRGSIAGSFISTKNALPVNGQVQDSVVGCARLTHHDTRMDKLHAMRMFATVRDDTLPDFSRAGPDGTFDGADIVSRLLARYPVSLSRRPAYVRESFAPYVEYDPRELRTVIDNGRLAAGPLDKATIGAKAEGGVYHRVARAYGPHAALDLIYSMQQVALGFLGNSGFTISTEDMLLTPRGAAQARELVAELLREAEELNGRLLQRQIVPPIGMSVRAFYERQMISTLRLPDRALGPVLQSTDPFSNGFVSMVALGSKGDTPNLIATMVSVGQIVLNNERIAAQFSLGRTLPYYPRFSLEPEAHGFVANSYISGLTSAEFVAAVMNGRFDLINKALSTSLTGAANRRAVMTLQSAITDNFRRAALAGGRVVQYLFGEDGLDARSVERVRLPHVACSNDAFEALRFVGGGPLPPALAAAAAAEMGRLRADRDDYRRMFLRLEALGSGLPFSDSCALPVNVGGLAAEVRSAAAGAPGPSAEELLAMHERVARFCEDLPYVFGNRDMLERRVRLPRTVRSACRLMQMSLRYELRLGVLAGLPPPALGPLLDTVWLRYATSLVEYGEAVGILSAQAVSEPLTQYMLDSHHRSVKGGTNKSGIVRPRELFGARGIEEESAPEMLLRVDPAIETDPLRVQAVADNVELLRLDQFLHEWCLISEPLPPPGGSLAFPPHADDMGWIAEYLEDHPLLPPPDLSSWCVRLAFDRLAMTLKGMPLETVMVRIARGFPQAYAVHSPENAPSIVVRVWLRPAMLQRARGKAAPAGRGIGSEEERMAAAAAERLLRLPLRGVPGVVSARVEKLSESAVAADGSIATRREAFGIRTVGTNLPGVLARPDLVVAASSNSVGDTLRVYGIEAARLKLMSEIRVVIGSGAPSARHLMLLADLMTATGTVTSLDKSGLAARERNNVLLRMAMSGPIQVMRDAAVEGTRCPVRGVAGPMLMGTIPRVGTLFNDVLVDVDFVAANTKSIDEVIDQL